MSIGGFILGIVNAAIIAVLMLLGGAIIKYLLKLIFNLDVPSDVERLYIGLTALVFIYLVIAAIFGLPSVNVFGREKLGMIEPVLRLAVPA